MLFRSAMNLIDTKIQISYAGNTLSANDVKGEISFENVNFSYGDQSTLQDISLTIPAGKTVAFVGSTGSGKSTLVKLLLRFYTPQSGHILLDGQKSDQINLQDLRRVIGYVAQDSFLTDGTIAENIAYGMSNASDDAIYDAARAAEALEFIEKIGRAHV